MDGLDEKTLTDLPPAEGFEGVEGENQVSQKFNDEMDKKSKNDQWDTVEAAYHAAREVFMEGDTPVDFDTAVAGLIDVLTGISGVGEVMPEEMMPPVPGAPAASKGASDEMINQLS